MTLDEINAMTRERFVESLGWTFEHSPWVAERAWEGRPFVSLGALHSYMVKQVELAHSDERLALLRAHPDLGSRVRMSAVSVSEQAGAGLADLTPAEHELLQNLNRTYREKFGFPFLLAVRGSSARDILTALQQRLGCDREREFREAIVQVGRIALFRLQDTISS